MKKLLEAQDRHQTMLKVAKEMEKYRKIKQKIDDFLERNKPKVSLASLLEPDMQIPVHVAECS